MSDTGELDRKEAAHPWVECEYCSYGLDISKEEYDRCDDKDIIDLPVCGDCHGHYLRCATCGEPWTAEHTCKPECPVCHELEGTGKFCRKCDQPWSEDHECGG